MKIPKFVTVNYKNNGKRCIADLHLFSGISREVSWIRSGGCFKRTQIEVGARTIIKCQIETRHMFDKHGCPRWQQSI